MICERRRTFHIEEIRLHLVKIIESEDYPAPSLGQAAQHLNHAPDFLKTQFPELCKKITERSWKKVDPQRLEAFLQEALNSDEDPPPTMADIGRRVKQELGYDSSQAQKYFPDLCRQIAAKSRSYKRMKREQRLQQLCDDVRQAVRTIHANGGYPSVHGVEKYLKKPGCMLYPEVVAAWRATVQELGLGAR